MTKFSLYLPNFFIIVTAIANLVRFLWNIPMVIGNCFLPGWTGGVLFILLGLVAAWSFRALVLFCRPPETPLNP
jgi:hypothetical protein